MAAFQTHTLWLPLLPAKMKKIHSKKIKALEWSRAANSVVGYWILPKFKLVQAFLIFRVTCKNKEDPSKIEGTRVVTTLLPL